MEQTLLIYNTLTRQKERFEPLNSPNVGMYVCGPTVYGDPHLGHARPAITFDILFRYLKHLGYKVRYVRNITDVGHLEHDADEGEDKIAKKARLEQLEPMEKPPVEFGERTQDCSPGHTAKEGPHLVRTGASGTQNSLFKGNLFTNHLGAVSTLLY